MAKFCHNCGVPLIDIAKFCASCGAQIPNVSAQPSQANQPQYASAVPATAPITNFVRDKGNGAYVRWFLFYFFFFSFFTAGIAIPVYIITVMIAFSKTAEKLWRKVSGVRPLRLKSEKSRLLPLFKEVYTGAFEANPDLSKGIKLYIKEDMNINAFAFGKETLVLTRGSFIVWLEPHPDEAEAEEEQDIVPPCAVPSGVGAEDASRGGWRLRVYGGFCAIGKHFANRIAICICYE